MNLYFNSGETGCFSVEEEPFNGENDDEAQIRSILFLLEIGSCEDDTLSFVDEDGERVFFRLNKPWWLEVSREIEPDDGKVVDEEPIEEAKLPTAG